MAIQFLAKAESRSVRWLRPVVAFDHNDVDVHGTRAQCLRLGIFGRAVAGERGRIVLELKHYVAAARLAFHRLECAAAHQKFLAVFAKHLREGDAVGLVPFRLKDIDAPNPISLRHVVLFIFAFSPPDFSRNQKGHCGSPSSHSTYPHLQPSPTTAEANPGAPAQTEWRRFGLGRMRLDPRHVRPSRSPTDVHRRPLYPRF